MRRFVISALVAFMTLSAAAQFYGISVDKLAMLMQETQKLPQANAVMVISSTMGALAQNPMAYRKALEMAEDRLGNPADSLHNEPMYIACLEHAVNSFVLGNAEKERYRMLLDMAMRNSIGSTAADIDYVTPDGKRHQLSEQGSQYTLLLFNDPECDACHKVKQNLSKSDAVKQLVEQGLLKVVAIYTQDNQKLWKKNEFPDWIDNGWDSNQTIEQQGTYVIPATLPVFYLLSPDKTVLIKNEPSLKRIERALEKVMVSGDNDPQSLAAMLFNN